MQWLQIFAPFIGPIITAVIKAFLPNIPKPVLPVLATVLGAAAATVGGADPQTALALGGSGVAVREIVDQAKQSATK